MSFLFNGSNPLLLRYGTVGNEGPSVRNLSLVDGINQYLYEYNLYIGAGPNLISYPCQHKFLYSDDAGVVVGAIPPPNNQALCSMQSPNINHPIVYYSDAPYIPKQMIPGDLIFKNSNSIIYFNNNDGHNIFLGDFNDKGVIINTQEKFINNNSNYNFEFSQAQRSIDSIIKREVDPSLDNFTLKLTNDSLFIKDSKTIKLFDTLDSSIDSSLPIINYISSNINYSLVENRKIVYEFNYNSYASSLENELKIFSKEEKKESLIDRHMSRFDCLGMNLNSPNLLIESTQGTVVDIYGNILDLNRNRIVTNLSTSSESTIQKQYLKILEDHRRALAFHFEINTKKDLGPNGTSPDSEDDGILILN